MKTTPGYEDLLEEISKIKAENEALRLNEISLKNRIARLERMLYGQKADRINVAKELPGQLTLFDDELKEAMERKAAEVEKAAREIEKAAERRRKAARKKPSRPDKYRYEGLEEHVVTVMPEGVDPDSCDIIGKDVTRILHRQPAKLTVEVIVRPILREKSDKDLPNPRIYQAPAPKGVIGGSRVASDMLAQIVIDKYRYHLPEYRQVKQYADLGLRISTSTVNDWVHATASRLEPLYEAQRDDIRRSCYLQADEVPWRVADRQGKSRSGYAWQFFDGRPRSHGLYFLYINGSRSGAVPRAELRDFRGALQTDGYSVYDFFERQDGVTLLGCMAHVRRKFADAQLSHPGLAAKAAHWIGLLYELEANLRAEGAPPEQVAAERKAKALPIMDAMEKWMEAASAQCTPSDPMGKAIEYAYKLWPRLRRYADNGIYQIDNNHVERNQRPSVLGRKNYLFSKSDNGAVDNAIFYSLIESCDIVGVNPLEWLKYALDNIRDDTPPDQIKNLLPYYYKKSRE